MQDRKMQDWKCRTGKWGTSFTSCYWIEKTQKFVLHRCITFTLSCAAAVINVSLKSAINTHSSHTDSAKNIEHVAVSGEHSQNHVCWHAAQWIPISHSSNRTCTCRAETGVAAQHQCYAVTWNQ